MCFMNLLHYDLLISGVVSGYESALFGSMICFMLYFLCFGSMLPLCCPLWREFSV